MEIDEVINAIYSGDADDAVSRLEAYLMDVEFDDMGHDILRIPVAAQKAKNARSSNKP